MEYTEEQIQLLQEGYQQVNYKYGQLLLSIGEFSRGISKQKAKEFLKFGVCRRLGLLERCIDNIYTIYPADRKNRLSSAELLDVDINLHAFYVNIYGIFDNLAWAFSLEHDLVGSKEGGKLRRNQIGLFHKQFCSYLPTLLAAHLQSSSVKIWYREYLKNYRDALVHRIPLYVPPASFTRDELNKCQKIETQLHDFSSAEAMERHEELEEKQNQLGSPCPLFLQSTSEPDDPICLHPQLLADFATVREITEKFLEHCSGSALHPVA